MRSKNRQYIRKSVKNGIKVEMGKDKNIEDFCRIIEEIAKEKNYVIHEMKYYKNVWENFRKEDKTVMLIAKYKEKIVGAYMLLFSRDCAYEMFGGCNKDGSILLTNYALKWESIKYSKKIGKKFYDQWGAELVHPGLVQFKEGFGGKVIEYSKQYVYIYNSIAYKIYKLLRKVRNIGS
jgi:lipid II:glycine glycyltransferase (peptidoglycan interpeptide bridge formation enzyme)